MGSRGVADYRTKSAGALEIRPFQVLGAFRPDGPESTTILDLELVDNNCIVAFVELAGHSRLFQGVAHLCFPGQVRQEKVVAVRLLQYEIALQGDVRV